MPAVGARPAPRRRDPRDRRQRRLRQQPPAAHAHADRTVSGRDRERLEPRLHGALRPVDRRDRSRVSGAHGRQDPAPEPGGAGPRPRARPVESPAGARLGGAPAGPVVELRIALGQSTGRAPAGRRAGSLGATVPLDRFRGHVHGPSTPAVADDASQRRRLGRPVHPQVDLTAGAVGQRESGPPLRFHAVERIRNIRWKPSTLGERRVVTTIGMKKATRSLHFSRSIHCIMKVPKGTMSLPCKMSGNPMT